MKHFIRIPLLFSSAVAYSTIAYAQSAPHPGGGISSEGRFEHPVTVGLVVGLTLVILVTLAWVAIKIYLKEAPHMENKS